jgi:hypothetical protein
MSNTTTSSGAVDEFGHYHPDTTAIVDGQKVTIPGCRVEDGDYHFLVNAIDRSIEPYTDSSENAPNATNKIKLTQYDHNSEIFTAEVPRWIEGHDMAMCNRIEIHFLNAGEGGSSEGVHLIDMEKSVEIVQGDPDRIMFAWPITMAATQYVGTLSFAIRFACVKPIESEDDEAELFYAWSTLPYSKIQIGKSINNAEVIVDKYQDILAQWENKLSVGVQSVKQTTKSFDSGGVNVITVTLTNGRTSSFEVRNGFSPEKGVDYWTDEDKAEILKYIYDSIPLAEGESF